MRKHGIEFKDRNESTGLENTICAAGDPGCAAQGRLHAAARGDAACARHRHGG